MNTTVPTPPSTRPTWISLSMLTDVSARWYDDVNRVVVQNEGRDLALHMDPSAAAQLAADLIQAVAESGAGSVPPVLLAAFANVAEVVER